MEDYTKVPEKVLEDRQCVDVLDFLQEATIRLMHKVLEIAKMLQALTCHVHLTHSLTIIF